MEDSPTVRKVAYCVVCKKSIPLDRIEEIEKELAEFGQTIKNHRCPVCGTPLVIREEKIEGKSE